MTRKKVVLFIIYRMHKRQQHTLYTRVYLPHDANVDPGPVSAILVPLFTVLFKPKEKTI